MTVNYLIEVALIESKIVSMESMCGVQHALRHPHNGKCKTIVNATHTHLIAPSSTIRARMVTATFDDLRLANGMLYVDYLYLYRPIALPLKMEIGAALAYWTCLCIITSVGESNKASENKMICNACDKCASRTYTTAQQQTYDRTMRKVPCK